MDQKAIVGMILVIGNFRDVVENLHFSSGGRVFRSFNWERVRIK